MSTLDCQIAELIAVGAAEVAIHADWLRDETMNAVHPSLRKRIVPVDVDHASEKTLRAIVAPIAEEVGLKTESLPSSYTYLGKEPAKPIARAIQVLLSFLPAWLLGLHAKAQVDINVAATRQAIAVLRRSLNSPHGLANLAALEGILATYQETTVKAVQLQSTATGKHLSLFRDFLEDEVYLSLSSEAHNLGYPTRFKRAATLLARHARDLLRKPFAKTSADLSSRAISTATQLPLPDSDTCQSLLSSGYLPPIISLKEPLARSRRDWERVSPDPVFPYSKVE